MSASRDLCQRNQKILTIKRAGRDLIKSGQPFWKFSALGWVSWGAVFVLGGCASKTQDLEDKPLKTLQGMAQEAVKKEKFEQAADVFEAIESQYPYSQEASRAQLYAAYCAYRAKAYTRALTNLDLFIALHPSSPSIDYAYYLRALCYYDDMLSALRDRENAELALQAFGELITRFPASSYAKEAKSRSLRVREHLASQDLLVAKGYMSELSYLAALQRLGNLCESWPQSLLIPETLYRMVECQVALGFLPAGKAIADQLRAQFPKNQWTQKAQDFVRHHTSKKAVVK
jgi:outer membrane protein assembly factor BamD